MSPDYYTPDFVLYLVFVVFAAISIVSMGLCLVCKVLHSTISWYNARTEWRSLIAPLAWTFEDWYEGTLKIAIGTAFIAGVLIIIHQLIFNPF